MKLITVYQQDMQCTNDTIVLSELSLWNEYFKNSERVPKNALELLNSCDSSLFPNIHILLRIFITIPVTTSTAERSFSTLRRLKTYLRNNMNDARLNGLAKLNIHREIQVDVEEVINYLRQNSRRLEFVL